MAHIKSDGERIASDRNTPRFCLENRQITWVLFFGTILWGIYAYYAMPKRKDPVFPVNRAAVVCPWPGVAAEKIEEQVTKKIEAAIAGNVKVEKIDSVSRTNLSLVYIILEENVPDTQRQWDDIHLRLNSIHDLPEGAGPITFLRDFGDTAALMLTFASPKADAAEISWRGTQIQSAIETARAKFPKGSRTSAVLCFPISVSPAVPRTGRDVFMRFVRENKRGHDLVPLDGPGFVGVDGNFGDDDSTQTLIDQFLHERLSPSKLHPDSWPPVVIRDPKDTTARLAASPGEKYSLKQLDDFTELVQRTLTAVPVVSKVNRSGVLKERIYLEYSQERLAAVGLQPALLPQLLAGRNGIFPGGLMEAGGKTLLVDPASEFRSEKEIGDILLTTTQRGSPVYLRDGIDTYRAYEPPLYLNFYMKRDAAGEWHRDRAVTLSVFMREGRQIADFARDVDAAMAQLKGRLPADLIVERTSDQPLQVEEIVSLFMRALVEAVVLVVLLSLIGFWEWRSALLMAISIPITLTMAFGMMAALNIDLQQVSIASLIIALGLLVDDPVVAIDSIKREMDAGRPRLIAAWLGPTKLATAILFATITNIVAYLPMLLINGLIGAFIYSLPIVLACALVASRIVSMTFVPLLGYYLLRKSSAPAPPMSERRQKGFAKLYYRFAGSLIDHRKLVLTAGVLILLIGGYSVKDLRLNFFPRDLSYLSYADLWLPEDATIEATAQASNEAGDVIRKVAEEYAKKHPDANGKPREVLRSVSTFVGGGSPRFWYSVAPEILQPNYAQLVIQVADKRDTEGLVAPLQAALSASVPGALIDVQQLETSNPIGVPIQIRISGEDEHLLRGYAGQVENIFRKLPIAARIRNNWGANAFSLSLDVAPDRANLFGITNRDVALSSAGGLSGLPVTQLREGDQEIPVVSRLRTNERAQLSDVENLYVYSFAGAQRVPLSEIGHVTRKSEPERIQRRNQFRTITVLAFPVPGSLPSDVIRAARPQITAVEKQLPPGYSMQIGGEEEERTKGFGQVTIVLIVSTALIFLALAFQFHSAVKPFIVFAAIPFGMVGAVTALTVMNTPFGFVAFLGIASLIGVIVSHVIVLFDFIEEAHSHGEPLREAILDAGILRLRPVLVTTGATILALIPLAEHGGPLWEPLCYAQIGGLLVATVVTLLLVPVLYAFFVLDLRVVRWDPPVAE